MCCKSLKYTVIAETIRATPIDTIYWRIKIKKYQSAYTDIPVPPNKTKANIILVEI